MSEGWDVNVYRITLLVIDFEGMREEDIIEEIERCKHSAPSVLKIEKAQTRWEDDDHPLNKLDTRDSAIKDLFGG